MPGSQSPPLLIAFSHLRWDFVWQRPQHLLSRAARHYDLIVVEEPVAGEVSAPRLDVTPRPGGIRVALPVLPEGTSAAGAIEAQRALVTDLLARETRGRPRVFWYYTPMAMAFSSDLERDLTVYDVMDELSAFRGAPKEMLSLEQDLFERADVVFTGGMSLYEAKRSRNPNVHYFQSSIEAEHFGKARTFDGPEPPDQASIPRPRIGFFGVIDERMDLGLVEAVAALRPDWQIVMIGPVVKIDPATLPKRDNIHWLGSKAYQELPSYLAGWDAGFMPFALNEATRFISPTKTPEFLAAGLPLVSTPVVDVVRSYGEQGLVPITRTPEEVVRELEILLSRPKGPWLAKVDRHLAAGSWDKTWAGMHRLMVEASTGAATHRPTRQTPVSSPPAE